MPLMFFLKKQMLYASSCMLNESSAQQSPQLLQWVHACTEHIGTLVARLNQAQETLTSQCGTLLSENILLSAKSNIVKNQMFVLFHQSLLSTLASMAVHERSLIPNF